MTLRRNLLISVLALIPVATSSCSGESDTSNGATGGTPTVGGGTLGPSTGGSVSTGGASTIQGTSLGGASNVGGATTAMSSAPQGGALSTGGTSSSGGTDPATGGTKATGGTTATGGTKATGGTTATGGTKATGGTTATGGTKATGGTTATGGTKATGGTTATGGGSSCPLPTTFKWKDFGGPLATPGNGWVSIKDFTTVLYNGQHLVYMSMHDNANYGGAMMAPFTAWSAAATTTQTKLSTSTVAPELMYFSPKSTWILSYQWCSAKFCYATSTDPTKASSWAYGKQLMTENITSGSSTGPIDQVVICDSTNCYLFYADDNGHIYRASMPIGNFPGTFSGSQLIMTDTKANLFEAVEVYTVKGTGKYLMIVEAMGSGGRYFRGFTATSLGGTWTAIPGASTEATPFAGKKNVTFTTAWTNDISHGDLVRTHDETRTIDPCNLQFLYQGRDPNQNPSYDLLPYRLGLLTATN